MARNKLWCRQITRRATRPRSLRTQREVLCDVLLAAGQCETWLTLHELAMLTGYGEASVSAQLRHLRKPDYGGFLVDKRLRGSGAIVRGECGPMWEYRLQRGLIVKHPRGPRRRRGAARSER